MDNILEFLVPLIFAGIYFFGNMFSKKSDEDAVPPGSSSSDDEADAIERQRRIQEEIRRKIMQRRNEAEGEGTGPSREIARDRGSPHPHASESARESTGHLSEQQRQSRHSDERRRDMQPQQKENRDRRQSPHPGSWIPDPASRIPHPASRIPQPASNPYGNEMQAQLEQIEATKRQAQKLKKQAAERTRAIDTNSSTSRTRRSGGRFGGSVRSTLRDPAAARTAFIYSEVLGPPVSQRKAQTVPGLVN